DGSSTRTGTTPCFCSMLLTRLTSPIQKFRVQFSQSRIRPRHRSRKLNAEFLDRRCKPRKQHRTKSRRRAGARTRSIGQVAHGSRPRPLDYLENKDKQDRYVLLVAREQSCSQPCTANKECLRNFRLLATGRCGRPSRWCPHKPDKPDQGPRLCFARQGYRG